MPHSSSIPDHSDRRIMDEKLALATLLVVEMFNGTVVPGLSAQVRQIAAWNRAIYARPWPSAGHDTGSDALSAPLPREGC